jgi:WD40 repeat protein
MTGPTFDHQVPPLPEPTDTLPTLPPPEGLAAGPADVTHVPGYEVLGILGRGGMGVVYRARHLALKRPVALKMILAGGHAGPADLARFRAEAEAVARLQHPNIVAIYEVGTADGLPFCALELVEGGNLAQKLNGKPLPPAEAARLIELLAGAMHLAHSRNVVHRDLKPANVLLAVGTDLPVCPDRPGGLSPQWAPKITDFGLAKVLEGQDGNTQTGAVMGTPSYMAPEQAEGRSREAGPAADVWALGAILYECLTGRPPFKGATPVETLVQVVTAEPVAPRQIEPSVPCDLETVCLKCLEKAPEKRYASARELAEDLERFRNGEPIRARPAGAAERLLRWARRRPAAAALVLVSVLALAGLVGGGSWFLALLARKNSELSAAKDNALGLAAREKEAGEQAQESARRASHEALRADHGRHALQLDLALGAWRRHDLDLAEKALADVDAPFRSAWESRHLASLVRRRKPRQLGRHVGIDRAAFSPDGALVAVGVGEFREPGEVKVCDAETGAVRLVLRGHADTVGGIAFSPNGEWIASGGRAGPVLVHDARTGRIRHVLKGHTAASGPVAFSPDGSLLLSAGDDGTVRTWDVRDGRQVRSLAAQPVGGVALTVADRPGGWWFATGGADNKVKLWDGRTGKALRTLEGHTHAVTALAFSPDGARVASASYDRTVKVWSAESGKELLCFRGHPLAVYCVAFSPDGSRLVSGDVIGGVRVWQEKLRWAIGPGEAQDAEELLVLPHKGHVYTAAFSPDGRRVLTSANEDEGGKVFLWDAHPGQERLALKGKASAVAASPDGGLIVAHEDKVRVRDGRTGAELTSFAGGQHAAFDGAGARIVIAGSNGAVTLRDARSGRALRTLRRPGGFVRAVALSADGRRCAALVRDVVTSWDAETGRELRALPGPAWPLALSHDGNFLAVAWTEGRVRLWDVRDGRELFALTGHTQDVRGLCFSPDGALLASASSDETARIWNTATGRERHVLKSHAGAVSAVRFSPRGDRLASANNNGDVLLWDVETGQRKLTLAGQREVSCLAFSADGRLLVSGGNGGVLLWEGP